VAHLAARDLSIGIHATPLKHEHSSAEGRTPLVSTGRHTAATARQFKTVPLAALRRQHAATVTKGGNPSVQRKSRRRVASVLDIIDAYLSDAKTRQRPRSYKETERHLRRHAAPLHHERADTVKRRDVAALLERVKSGSGPIAANRVRAARCMSPLVARSCRSTMSAVRSLLGAKRKSFAPSEPYRF
jgi:hypothetical protein